MSAPGSATNTSDMKSHKAHISFTAMALLGALALFVFAACKRNQFSLEFQLPQAVNNAYTLSYYASDSRRGFMVESAVPVQQGKGKAELRTVNPTIVTISIGGYRVFFFAKGGDNVKISSDEADPYSWNISGNSLNEEWSRWRIENRAVLSSGNVAQINKAVGKYVTANPTRPLSTLLLLLRYDRREDNAGFLKLWKLLREDAADGKWISLVARADLVSLAPLPAPDFKKPLKMVFKSLANGADTVITGKVPVVIYCWRGQDAGRKEAIDSLRRLRKLHPDSAQFLIVDVCFDSDSISWNSPLAHDSLTHTVRAWTPLAENDSIIRILGIERSPAFITIPPIPEKKK